MPTLINEIDKALRKYASKTAFDDGETQLTFSDVDDRVGEIANWLTKHCDEGDRVAVLTRNRIDTILLEWATYRVGCIWIGIPFREREIDELTRLLEDFTPRLLVIERATPFGEVVFTKKVFPAVDVVIPKNVLQPNVYRALKRSACYNSGVFSIDGELIQRIRYSSGAGGERKAVAYSSATALAIENILREEILDDPHESVVETVVHAVPITWASGSLIAPSICMGCKNVVLESWDVRRFANIVGSESSVLSLIPPRLLADLVKYATVTDESWLGNLRCALLAGTPTSVWTMRQALEVFRDTRFIVTLGQTEASFPITRHVVSPRDVSLDGPSLIPLGALTRPYKESRVGEDGKEGELLLRGDPVAPGKWKPSMPGPGGEFVPFDRPFLRSGDRVRKGADGVLHYLGHVANSWQVNDRCPPPFAIEAVVDACPGVKRSRVDWVADLGSMVSADMTVQGEGADIDDDRIRSFFRKHRDSARLAHLELGDITVGRVEVTLTGKIKR